jgi:hypothetical protein
MRISRSARTKIVLMTAASVALYVGLLAFPQPLFQYSVRAENIVLHSDRPFCEGSAIKVLHLAERNIARSPLYSNARKHNVFICNSRWRQMLFFNKDYGVAGVAQAEITPNVVLRDARIEDNRLISPRGTPVPGDRTLDYYVAHEIAHQLTAESIGGFRFHQLPQWVREGYADYIGIGYSFNYDLEKRAFLAGKRDMDFAQSGLYKRFHLLVAYLIDHQHWTVERLLNDPPSQAAVESSIRQERP